MRSGRTGGRVQLLFPGGLRRQLCATEAESLFFSHRLRHPKNPASMMLARTRTALRALAAEFIVASCGEP